jgi:dimethylhistidine N-methyltransferase
VFVDGAPDGTPAALELRESLLAERPFIAPKFLYDRLGSALFRAICELDEYYPTRTEAAILARCAGEIGRSLGQGATLVDLGAGDCVKAQRLFEAVDVGQYVAVDISTSHLRDALGEAWRARPDIRMVGLGLDFSAGLALPDIVDGRRRVFFYPGSSIGNFSPAEACTFLRGLRTQTDTEGGLLIGVDLEKALDVLVPAYDDALGVTAAFNLNLLRNVNRLLGTDFDPLQWAHRALYDTDEHRIEMRVRARCNLTVSWPGGARRFAEGDEIHTENSYKYTPARFEALLAESGFEVRRAWFDEREWFGVYLARPV